MEINFFNFLFKRRGDSKLNLESPTNNVVVTKSQEVKIAESRNNKPAKPVKKCADSFKGGKEWKRHAEDLMRKLKAHKMICKNTRIRSFQQVFTGNPTDKKIIWTGQKDELAYFIKRMSAEGLIEVEKYEIWLVTQKCFQLPEGECLNHRNLKTYDPPRRAEIIDDVTHEFKLKVDNSAKLTKQI